MFFLNILPIHDAKEKVKLTKKNWSTHAEKGEELLPEHNKIADVSSLMDKMTQIPFL